MFSVSPREERFLKWVVAGFLVSIFLAGFAVGRLTASYHFKLQVTRASAPQ